MTYTRMWYYEYSPVEPPFYRCPVCKQELTPGEHVRNIQDTKCLICPDQECWPLLVLSWEPR